jgi:hypothetical protein
VGGDRSLSIVVAEEVEHGAGCLQLRLIDVEIDPIEGLQFQGHVMPDDISDGAPPIGDTSPVLGTLDDGITRAW